MGRKNRKRIKKETKDNEKEDIGIINQEDHVYQKDYKQFEIAWSTRRELIQYCDNNAIPLCDYLTIGPFQDFIEYISK